VTLWLRGNASAISPGFPLGGGIVEREFNYTDNLPDREFPWEASLFNLDLPGVSFSGVTFATDGTITGGADGISFGTVGFGFSLVHIESASLSREVNRQLLDNALSNALSPGVPVSLIGYQIMVNIFNPSQSTEDNGNLGITWRLPIRTPSDKTDNSN
jgi:hypothetical protein